MIRYFSTTMPLMEELGNDSERINVEEEEESSATPTEPIPTTESKQCCERTFITFSNDDVFKTNLGWSKLVPPKRSICPITRFVQAQKSSQHHSNFDDDDRQPAKYFDPVTRMPYANKKAFLILRETYYNKLEMKGDSNDPEIARWIEWRQKYRKAKMAALAAKQQQSANANLNVQQPASTPVSSSI